MKKQEIISNIQNNIEVRANVLRLKNEVKEHPTKAIPTDLYLKLLENEDVKVRKNTAIIIQYCQPEKMVEPLITIVFNEQNWIVKSELLKALSMYDLNGYYQRLEDFYLQLDSESLTNLPHIEAARTILFELFRKQGYFTKPTFKEPDHEVTCLLTVQESVKENLSNALDYENKKQEELGVSFNTTQIEPLFSLRYFDELLFKIPHFDFISYQLESLTTSILSSNIFSLLDNMHKSKQFGFRINTDYLHDNQIKRSDILKLGQQIQNKSAQRLINTTSQYDFEIIFYPTANSCLLYIKLYTLVDPRFTYRQVALSNSIQPYIAATICELIDPYLVGNADVLDPMCGVGTMLIERAYKLKCHFTMGVDYYGKAIAGAMKNSNSLPFSPHYVQKEIQQFTHPHQFDEMISNLPIQTSQKSRLMIEATYCDLLDQALKLVKPEGYLFLFTFEYSLLKKCLKFYNDELTLIDTHQIDFKNNQGMLFIIQLNP